MPTDSRKSVTIASILRLIHLIVRLHNAFPNEAFSAWQVNLARYVDPFQIHIRAAATSYSSPLLFVRVWLDC